MKKMIALVLAIGMLGLTACSGQKPMDASGAGSEGTSSVSPEPSAEQNQLQKQMDSCWDGLDEVLKEEAGYPMGNQGMGAVVLAIKDGQIVFEQAYGYAHYFDADDTAEGASYANPVYVKTAQPRKMTTDTLFDLASVTKVMATTQSIMILVDRGEISVEDKVATYLPGFEANGKGEITIDQLLTHSSGLPQWEPTFLYCDSKEEQLEYIKQLELNPEYKTDGSEPMYSDFSFMTLGFIVEAVSGKDMDVFAKENIYEPLGMNSTTYKPLENGFAKEQIAATSLGNPYEYRMVDEANWEGVGYDCTKDAQAFAAFDGWRDHTLIGEVNDGNAGMGGKGVAGHAGLYSTAHDLSILLQCMINGGEYNGVRLYSKETVDLFTTRHTTYQENHADKEGKPVLSQEFGYGFKLDQSWMGDSATEAAFGHDGFTGTTVFADPENNYIFICLTNKMQAGFRKSTANGAEEDVSNYYNTNTYVSRSMNQIVRDHLGI